jgi:16S rRNA (uracil1498-N3)-methyltransferase
MNLLLLKAEQFTDQGLDQRHGNAKITGRQFQHLVSTLKAKVGDTLNVGIENGMMGQAQLMAIESEQAIIEFDCTEPPPPALPLKLVLALPRPKMLRRTLQSCISMGVKDIILLNSWKVEKSYWQTPWLNDQALYENAVLGLEQAKDTVLPNIQLRKLFKPFVEDELRNFSQASKRILAHPGGASACPVNLEQPCTLVIGPEGGFTSYEAEKIQEQDFEVVNIGERILRVETAVPALISRIFPS